MTVMTFAVDDRHFTDYHQLGFCVFRGLLPTALLRDLRREADKGRAIARRLAGDQAQRLQPIQAYPELDMRPFDDLYDLPALRTALNRVLGPGFRAPVDPRASRDLMGVLYEPAAMPWATCWHRDWRDNVPGLQLAEWDKLQLDTRYFNQVNCALYDDDCTWVVPGSHLRRDTAGEMHRFPTRPIAGPALEGLDVDDAERACMAYCESMPGAHQVHLHAGDYLLYRNSLWHLGNYAPYKRRATIHDGVMSPEFSAFWKAPPLHPVREDGSRPHENPNEAALAALAG
ncbi:MAG: hypothetical protein H0W72_13065 [Planctomycetes bacterium]|nr:hypothetical protein [Planctomycetota bacterium]